MSRKRKWMGSSVIAVFVFIGAPAFADPVAVGTFCFGDPAFTSGNPYRLHFTLVDDSLLAVSGHRPSQTVPGGLQLASIVFGSAWLEGTTLHMSLTETGGYLSRLGCSTHTWSMIKADLSLGTQKGTASAVRVSQLPPIACDPETCGTPPAPETSHTCGSFDLMACPAP